MALPQEILDLDPVDFCGEQVASFSEVLFTRVFEDPALNEIATIVTGIKAKKQLVILGVLDLVGRKKTLTQCAPLESEEGIDSVEKFWDPEHIEDRFTECWKNLLDKFTVWGLKNGINKPDLTGTDFGNFMEDQIIDGLRRSVFRIAWFSDTAADNFSGTGHVSNGRNLDYFNPIDGFWKQFYAIAAADPSKRITVAKNAGASFDAQKFDAADVTNQTVTGYFQAMYEAADERLLAEPTLAFYVTRSMAIQYKKERTKNFPNIEIAYTRTEAGWEQLEFEGIPVKILAFQDRMIKSYFSSATAAYQPHRAYLTALPDMQIGTEQEGDFEQVESWYEKKDKQVYFDTLYTIDALFGRDENLVVAY